MRRYIEQAVTLARSGTARDTYILFIGNILSAFFSFIFTLLVARALSVSEFGVFSAVINLATITVSLSDLGVSSGLVSFVANAYSKGKLIEAQKYIKAALIIKLLVLTFLVSIIYLFAPAVSKNLLATSNINTVYWVGGLSLALLMWGLFPTALRAQSRFLPSVGADLSLSGGRVLITLAFLLTGGLTLTKSFISFIAASFFAMTTGFILLKTSFLFVKVRKNTYLKLLRFSGWLGVNKIISSISGRLDVQMLAAIAGATATGLYSISSKLSFFIVVLTSSLSSVLAPRFASFGDKEKEKLYLKKAVLVVLPIIVGIVVWILIADPFITILFGQKYKPAVPVFRALAASMIPFIITAPSVTAIVYAIKKPVYIGVFSFFQLAAIFLINYLLIPKVGAFAPTIAFGFVHVVLAIYTWTIVIRHYWR